MARSIFGCCLLTILVQTLVAAEEPLVPARPLFREFMGLNGHTIQFKASRYASVCRAVRDYHPFDWDTGDDTSAKPAFPSARNGVDWKAVYGSWKAAGYETDVCIMFDNLPLDAWTDLASNARAYGKAFASAFGPSSSLPLVAAVEVGNEPGLYDDATYRTLFENMARGLRSGDSKLVIGTCAVTTGPSDRYSKSVNCFTGMEPLYDYLNIHTYAEVEGWPTWKRTFPEDPSADYLRRVEQLIEWRDHHARGKEIRVTEFGWDASTKPAPTTGDFSRWMGSTETQQAQYLVRSFLLFSKLDVARAYIFFFDDKDEPQVHGSSGLTRNGIPKPAFFAVAHLQETLGDYRFSRVVLENRGDIYLYEYMRADDPDDRVWVAWSPTGTGNTQVIEMPIPGMKFLALEKMPLTEVAAQPETPKIREGALTLQIDETPVYVRLRAIARER